MGWKLMHDGWSRIWGLNELFIGLCTKGVLSLNIIKTKIKLNNKRKIRTKIKKKYIKSLINTVSVLLSGCAIIRTVRCARSP
jgi:hypothetical protein